jgi:uncharacterized protein (TIGR00730 family)
MSIKNSINFVTVYAASSCNIDEIYLSAARELGKLLAKHSITCIYGGGPNGLMGAVANSALDNGGKVCGIIPKFMIERGWLNTRLTDVVTTDDMHRRKSLMAERSDACIALPGGIGTLEELLEIITWRQLGLYCKPIIILNVNGFYDYLLEMLHKIEKENFMRHGHEEIWSVAKTPEEALDLIFSQAQNPITPLE